MAFILNRKLSLFNNSWNFTRFHDLLCLGNSCNSFRKQQSAIKSRWLQPVSRGRSSQHTFTSTKEQRCRRRWQYTRGPTPLSSCWGYSHLLLSPGEYISKISLCIDLLDLAYFFLSTPVLAYRFWERTNWIESNITNGHKDKIN